MSVACIDIQLAASNSEMNAPHSPSDLREPSETASERGQLCSEAKERNSPSQVRHKSADDVAPEQESPAREGVEADRGGHPEDRGGNVDELWAR